MPGHPPDVSDEQKETIRRRRAEGATLRAIATELSVHHSTVAEYVKETEQLRPDDIYAELVSELRDALEANLREALESTESMDYRRMRDVMQKRNVLTQQAKGLLASKGLYMSPSTNTSAENGEAEGFLATLAQEDEPKRKRKRTTAGSGAASRAT